MFTREISNNDASVIINACELIMSEHSNGVGWNESKSLHLLLRLLVKNNTQLAYNNSKLKIILNKYFHNQYDQTENYETYLILFEKAANSYLKLQSKQNQKRLISTINFPIENTSRKLAVSFIGYDKSDREKLFDFFGSLLDKDFVKFGITISKSDLEFLAQK